MFILVFLVMFGPKKGSIIAYSANWDFKNSLQLPGLLRTSGNNNIQSLLKYRFHFTSVTSRFTSYVLFTFWIFFFFLWRNSSSSSFKLFNTYRYYFLFILFYNQATYNIFFNNNIS
jgi:hypothetical protein